MAQRNRRAAVCAGGDGEAAVFQGGGVRGLLGLLGEGPARRVVTIRGKRLEIRELLGAESSLLRAVSPSPAPPVRNREAVERDGAKPEYDYDAPSYQEAFVRWEDRLSAAKVGVALGLEDSQGRAFGPRMSADQARAWLDEVPPALLAGLGVPVLRAIVRELDAIGSEQEAMDEGKGGCSPGSPPPP